MEPGKLGAGGNSASEGVLANFFNSLLSNKRADRLSAGGVAGGQASIGNSPGGVAVGASPTGQKPLGGTNDDCKFQNKYVYLTTIVYISIIFSYIYQTVSFLV